MTNLSVKPMSPGKAWLILIGLLLVLACAIYWPLNDFRRQQLQSEANLERLVSKKRNIIASNKQISSNIAAIKKEISQIRNQIRIAEDNNQNLDTSLIRKLEELQKKVS